MNNPPTREAYQAVIARVKMLEEEVAYLRNNKAKIGKSTTNMKGRNSWATLKQDSTFKRKRVTLLGEEHIIDKFLGLRVKWAQRGIGFFSLLGCPLDIHKNQPNHLCTQGFCASLVIILITPPRASAPYNVDAGPRITSMRSIASIGGMWLN